MDGIVLIDKPQKYTSHDVVSEIKKILRAKKAGHFGTLDPLATGLMVVAVGKATKLFPFYSKSEKVYKGRIRLGFSTDTYDSSGKPVSEEKKEYPQRDGLLQSMKKYEGELEQIPPAYSAKKYRGKPLYALVRRKKEFELKPIQVFIRYFRLTDYSPPFLEFEVHCSSGTYIRSLAHDLGQSLGCGAHLIELTRIASGDFQIKESYTLEKIKKLAEEGKFDEFLIPIERLLAEFPKIVLDGRGTALARNGNMVFPENILKITNGEPAFPGPSQLRETFFRMFSPDEKLIAIAKQVPEKNSFHPFLVIIPEVPST